MGILTKIKLSLNLNESLITYKELHLKNILEPVFKPFRFIQNQSEKHFVLRLIKKGQKSIRINAIQSEVSIRTNPNQVFNLKEFKLGFIEIEFLIQNWIDEDSFELMPRIESN